MIGSVKENAYCILQSKLKCYDHGKDEIVQVSFFFIYILFEIFSKDRLIEYSKKIIGLINYTKKNFNAIIKEQE